MFSWWFLPWVFDRLILSCACVFLFAIKYVILSICLLSCTVNHYGKNVLLCFLKIFFFYLLWFRQLDIIISNFDRILLLNSTYIASKSHIFVTSEYIWIRKDDLFAILLWIFSTSNFFPKKIKLFCFYKNMHIRYDIFQAKYITKILSLNTLKKRKEKKEFLPKTLVHI